jgi:hypothetical protein
LQNCPLVSLSVSQRRGFGCYKSLKGVSALSEKFNLNEHLRTLARRKKVKDSHGEHWVEENHVYLDVKWRLIWFRCVYPEGFIQTVEAEVNDKFARIEATAYDKDPAQGGKKLGMGRRLVYASDFHDYVEKAETQAIGRALAVAGFGTQFCEEFDEDDILADSPVERRKQDTHSAPLATPTTSAVPVSTAMAPEKEQRKSAKESVASTKISEPVSSPASKPISHPASSINLAYDAALRKGLSRNDTDLLVAAKYQKLSISDLPSKELDEFVAGIKSTAVDSLRDFVDRYKASLEIKNAAVA